MGKGGANSWSLKHIGMNKRPVLDGRFRACRRREEYGQFISPILCVKFMRQTGVELFESTNPV
jgi:hypothetical protein